MQSGHFSKFLDENKCKRSGDRYGDGTQLTAVDATTTQPTIATSSTQVGNGSAQPCCRAKSAVPSQSAVRRSLRGGAAPDAPQVYGIRDWTGH